MFICSCDCTRQGWGPGTFKGLKYRLSCIITIDCMIPVPMYGDDVSTPGEQIARVADRGVPHCLTVPGVNNLPQMLGSNSHSHWTFLEKWSARMLLDSFSSDHAILKNNHPCSGPLPCALPATNVVSPSSHSLLTKLTQPSMTFPKPNMSKCAFKWDENNVVFVADYSWENLRMSWLVTGAAPWRTRDNLLTINIARAWVLV